MPPRLVPVLVFAAAASLAVLAVVPAFARDGSSGGGSSGGGSSGGGSSGGGSSGGGSSGSGSSGHGSSGTGSSGSGLSGNGSSGDGGSGGSGSATSGRSADVDGRTGEDGYGTSTGHDHDVARAAVLRGNALPFAKVIPTVQAAVRGDMLDVKLRRLGSGLLVYDVKVVAPDGVFRSVLVDAKRNRVVSGGRP